MDAIRSALNSEARPLSPAELHELARADVPNIGMATIYRAIQRLLESGDIQAVDVPGQPPRYMLKTEGPQSHCHFLCRKCNKMYVIEGSPVDVEAITPEGFEVEDYHLVLTGNGPDCS